MCTIGLNVRSIYARFRWKSKFLFTRLSQEMFLSYSHFSKSGLPLSPVLSAYIRKIETQHILPPPSPLGKKNLTLHLRKWAFAPKKEFYEISLNQSLQILCISSSVYDSSVFIRMCPTCSDDKTVFLNTSKSYIWKESSTDFGTLLFRQFSVASFTRVLAAI